ncbi:unnamed protein product, partial [Ectocarpus sp. 12 AP-2014]
AFRFLIPAGQTGRPRATHRAHAARLKTRIGSGHGLSSIDPRGVLGHAAARNFFRQGLSRSAEDFWRKGAGSCCWSPLFRPPLLTCRWHTTHQPASATYC